MLCLCVHHWKDMVESWINLKIRKLWKRMQRASRCHHSGWWLFGSDSLLMLSHHLLQFTLTLHYKIIFFLFLGLRLNWGFLLFGGNCLLNIQSKTFLRKFLKFFFLLKPFNLLFGLLSDMYPIILIITFFLRNFFLFDNFCHLNIILWMIFKLCLFCLFI